MGNQEKENQVTNKQGACKKRNMKSPSAPQQPPHPANQTWLQGTQQQQNQKNKNQGVAQVLQGIQKRYTESNGQSYKEALNVNSFLWM